MPDRRGSRRNPRRDVADALVRSMVPAPADRPLTPYDYRGEPVTPGSIIRLWRYGQSLMQPSRDRILKVRAFRRMEPDSAIQLSPTWRRNNPEAASWVQDIDERRVTLEQDLIARIGAVEPRFVRNASGFRDRDRDDAMACRAMLEEWRQQSVPVQTMYEKLTEDGDFIRVTMPIDLDMDGCPDLFEYLDEQAYEQLREEEKSEYERDEADRRKRYVRKGKDGTKQRKREYEDGDRGKQRHEEAVQRYLLDKESSSVRLVPALDAAPIFTRGKGRSRWELEAFVERTLYDASELEAEYAWRGMGDRKLIPLAYNADGTSMRVRSGEVGSGGQFYLYTAYVPWRDEDGIVHPCLFYTVGGAATWDDASGDPGDPNSVGCIDLYEEYGIEGKLWSYHAGLHSADDDPAYYARPYLWPFYHRIRQIEGTRTAINAHVHVSGFPGDYAELDSSWARDDISAQEAVLEEDNSLRRPRKPRSGEIEVTPYRITPAVPGQMSPDTWRVLAADEASLAAATAVDQMPGGPGPSGHAMVVQSSLAQVAKRHIRDGVLDAVVAAGQDQLRVWWAIWKRHGVKWPMQAVQERAVGSEMREGEEPMAFDPAWLGPGGKAVKLKAEYPPEENLARRDLEMNAYERKLGTLKRVAQAAGEEDEMRFRKEILKDQLWNDPVKILSAQERLAKQAGDAVSLKLIKLRQAELMAPADVPGVPGGVPTSMLNRRQAAPGTSGGPTQAQAQRGGIEAAEMGAAQRAVDDVAAMQAAG